MPTYDKSRIHTQKVIHSTQMEFLGKQSQWETVLETRKPIKLKLNVEESLNT